MRNKLILAGLAGLAALAIACGSGSGNTQGSVSGDGQSGAPAPANDGPVTAAIGQTVTLTNTLLGSTDKVEVTLANPQTSDSDPGSSFNKPSHGTFLAVDVTIVCVEGTYFASPFNFTFVAADGTAYDTGFTTGFTPELDSINLNAGQRTAGKVVFDVPAAAITGGKIQIDGIGLDAAEGAAYWTL